MSATTTATATAIDLHHDGHDDDDDDESSERERDTKQQPRLSHRHRQQQSLLAASLALAALVVVEVVSVVSVVSRAMDKTPTVLDQLVTHAFVPHVLLVTTKGVDEACLKNGPHCRLINLLQPLCHFENARTTTNLDDLFPCARGSHIVVIVVVFIVVDQRRSDSWHSR